VLCAPRVIEDYELGADQGGSIQVDERLQLVELEFEVSRRNPVKHALAFKTGQRCRWCCRWSISSTTLGSGYCR
jgi:hypothetical protein